MDPKCRFSNGKGGNDFHCLECFFGYGNPNGVCEKCTPGRKCRWCINDLDSCSRCGSNYDLLTDSDDKKYCVECQEKIDGCYHCNSIDGGCRYCHWRYGRVYDHSLGYHTCKKCKVENCKHCNDDESICTHCYYHSAITKGYYLENLDNNRGQICRPMCDREYQFAKPSRSLVHKNNSCVECFDKNCKKCFNDTLDRKSVV